MPSRRSRMVGWEGIQRDGWAAWGHAAVQCLHHEVSQTARKLPTSHHLPAARSHLLYGPHPHPPPTAGDLFDFDFEVEPILEVLVGKVLEQGLMEVLEEEELAAMRAHQEHFEQIRNAELVATQRMEAAEKRKNEEKERRMQQVGCSRGGG